MNNMNKNNRLWVIEQYYKRDNSLSGATYAGAGMCGVVDGKLISHIPNIFTTRKQARSYLKTYKTTNPRFVKFRLSSFCRV